MGRETHSQPFQRFQVDCYLTYRSRHPCLLTFTVSLQEQSHSPVIGFSCGFHAEPVRTGCSRAVPYGGMLSIVQMIGFQHWLAFTFFCFELVMAETCINCWDGVEKLGPSKG